MPKLVLLRNRSFTLLWLGQGGSLLGDALRRIAITLWVFEVSGHAGPAIAALMIAELAPIMLLGPVAGVVVDRWDRRRVMLVTDIVRAGLSLCQIVAVVNGSISITYAVTALAAAVGACFAPAQNALMPEIIRRDELQRANAIMSVTLQASFVVGPALGAAMYYRAGPVAVFVLDSVSFLGSAASLFVMKGGPRMQPSERLSAAVVLRDVRDGVVYSVRNRVAAVNMCLGIGIMATAGINNTAMIFFITRTLNRDPASVAWLSAANGVAQITTGGILTALARRTRLDWVLILGALAMAIGGLVVASSWSLPMLVVGVVITALGNAPFNIARATVYQIHVAPDY